jgi:hypothetical protein
MTKPLKMNKKQIFGSLLSSLSKNDFQKFIISYATKNNDFKTEFELFFADRDSQIDVEKTYTDLINKLIQKYSNRGFIDYRFTALLSRDLNRIVATGQDYLSKSNFRDAFSLAKAVLKSMIVVIQNCDDSNNDIGENAESAIALLEMIADSNTASIDIKEAVFTFLRKELNCDDYFNYGNFGENMFLIFQQLAVLLNESTVFLEYIEGRMPKILNQYSNYHWEFLIKQRIKFFEQTGKTAESQKLITAHLDIVELRENVLKIAIAKKDFAAAKKIIAEGIKIATKKAHIGTVQQWERQLFEIAKLENDILAIRSYAKHFAFNNGFVLEYYQQWKKTFHAVEWNSTIELYIAETRQTITADWKKNKWKSETYPPLLYSLGPIYIQEKYWDRLFILVQQKNCIYATKQYQQYLIKDYSNELLQIYLPALEEVGNRANSRGEYANLVGQMERIMKDFTFGKEQVLDIARKLKEQFSIKPRRPAMLEELSKIV